MESMGSRKRVIQPGPKAKDNGKILTRPAGIVRRSTNNQENKPQAKPKANATRTATPAVPPLGIRKSVRNRAAPVQVEPATSAPTGTAARKSPPRMYGREPDWANPKSEKWDVLKYLQAHDLHAVQDLSARPPPRFEFIVNGKLREKYTYRPQTAEYIVPKQKNRPDHPKWKEHVKNGTTTDQNQQYYANDLDPKDIAPIAGVIFEKEAEYKLKDHLGRIVRDLLVTSEVLEAPIITTKKILPPFDVERLEEREFDYLQEGSFHARPSIKIVIPDHIKAILVDDWENVTKNNQLVPLPAEKPVNQMLDDYMNFEKPKRQEGSAQADILEEVIAGLKEYFDKCLGRILLYRFERTQYLDFRESWLGGNGELKGPGDVYGAEHLCRLLVTLPELIAQTNMDLQSVNRLREELYKLTQWIGKNTANYFVAEYETPGQEYIDKARSV